MNKTAERTSYSILVIEDNEGDYFLIHDYLAEGNQQIEVDRASTYREARTLLSEPNVYDVIILDLTLPDLSGEELIKKTLNLKKDAVLIVLTGYSDMEFSVKSLSLGVSDYLLKDDLSANFLWKSIRYSRERKAASVSVKKSEERYRSLFQNNPSPMIIRGEKGRIMDINQAAIEKYGYDYDQFKSIYIEAVRAHREQEPDLELPSGKTENNLWLHKNKSGELFFAEVISHPVDINNQPATLDIVTDITDKIEMQEKIIENTIRAEEEERSRIAKELHDSIVQKLAACGMFVQNLHDYVEDNEELHQKIDRLHKLISDIANETRDLSHNLKSAEFEISSLPQLIDQLTRQLTKESGITFEYNNHIEEGFSADSVFKTHIYRIIQELCSNVIKHSEATRAVITSEIVGNKLYISFSDNGDGFDVTTAQNRGIGIRNIRSRVYRLKGDIEFDNMQNKGIHIHIELPLPQ